MKRVEKLYKTLNVIVITGLILSSISPFIDPRVFWPIAFFGLSFSVWLFFTFCILIWGLVIRKRHLIFTTIALLVCWPIEHRSFALNKENKKQEAEVNVVSFNTFKFFNNVNNAKELSELLKDLDADIVVLHEWRRTLTDVIKYPFHTEFKHSVNSGIQLLSNHQIIRSKKIKLENTYSDAGYADIKIGKDTIRVYALHLESNLLRPEDYHKIISPEINEKYREHAKGILMRVRRSMRKRADQVQEICKHMEKSPYPIIICSDLNDTPQSYAYQQLRGDKKDAFIERGFGWEGTYVKPFPFLRIDYILFDQQFECVQYQSIKQHYSDHKLIFSSFNIKKKLITWTF